MRREALCTLLVVGAVILTIASGAVASDHTRTVAPATGSAIRVDWSAYVSIIPYHGAGTLSGTLGVFEVEQPGDFFLLQGDGSLTVRGAGFDDPTFNVVLPFISTVGAPAIRFDSLDPLAASFISTSEPPTLRWPYSGVQWDIFHGLAPLAYSTS